MNDGRRVKELTARQREVLDFISRRLAEQGYPPTMREIGEALDIRSTNGVSDHLKALVRKGYLTREAAKSRAYRIANACPPSDRPADASHSSDPEDLASALARIAQLEAELRVAKAL
jgi:SOS-response transcriptional repressor LexA